jgi:hypothetical protein
MGSTVSADGMVAHYCCWRCWKCWSWIFRKVPTFNMMMKLWSMKPSVGSLSWTVVYTCMLFLWLVSASGSLQTFHVSSHSASMNNSVSGCKKKYMILYYSPRGHSSVCGCIMCWNENRMDTPPSIIIYIPTSNITTVWRLYALFHHLAVVFGISTTSGTSFEEAPFNEPYTEASN